MTNRLLLDTCAVIWIAGKQPMSARSREEIDAALAQKRVVAVSVITAWELGLLSRKGRLPSARPPSALFASFVGAPGIALEQLTAELLIDSSFLPGDLHGDPADRIIIATARALDFTVVTRDRHILRYAEAGHVRALPC